MKLAGQKNPGAWERARKDLADFSASETQALNLAIQGLSELEPAYNALMDYSTQMGVDQSQLPTSAQAWAFTLASGALPLQVWMGHLTTTTYTKDGTAYKANYQSQIHYFAKELRKLVKRFVVAERQALNALVNEKYKAPPPTLVTAAATPAKPEAKKRG